MKQFLLTGSISDPHWFFDADPETDPDPAFFLNADPYTGSQTNADPDPNPGPGQT